MIKNYKDTDLYSASYSEKINWYNRYYKRIKFLLLVGKLFCILSLPLLTFVTVFKYNLLGSICLIINTLHLIRYVNLSDTFNEFVDELMEEKNKKERLEEIFK